MKLVSGNDVVYTPDSLAKHIVDYYNPQGWVLEPCVGGGAFTRAFHGRSGIDKVWMCEIEDGHDFFDFATPVDWIVTNPPWSKMRSFINHAMGLTSNIVFLSLFNHFVTRARYKDIQDAGFGLKEALLVPTPKKPWPQSGFQLTAMHVQRHWEGPLAITNHNHITME